MIDLSCEIVVVLGPFDYPEEAPIRVKGWDGWDAHRRKAAEMLGSPASLSRLMAVLRKAAIIWGAEPVLTWERSSSMVTSLTQWTRFSIPRVLAKGQGAGRDPLGPVRDW